jgi:hypothetical protein
MEKAYGQWTVETREDGYTINNRGEDGQRQYYEVKDGPWGMPVLEMEPDRALSVPEGLCYVDSNGETVMPDEKIGGIFCKIRDQIVHRFSLSSPNAPDYTIGEDGVLIIDGQEWHLVGLFSKDKNRYKNYDGFYGPEKPDAV